MDNLVERILQFDSKFVDRQRFLVIYKKEKYSNVSSDKNTGYNISYPASPASVVFGQRLSARFPCPTGQKIARNPPLRVASYVVGHIISPLETQSVFEKAFKLRVLAA